MRTVISELPRRTRGRRDEATLSSSTDGVPPHARGRRRVDRPTADTRFGAPPGCAGPTRPRRSSRPGRAENPRVRGADGSAAVLLARPTGEPPRARGRLRPGRSVPQPPRRTHACAGPPPTVRPPHGTGEPPRARGRRLPRLGELDERRRTPACAGPTTHASPRTTKSAENPRVRWADTNYLTYRSQIAENPRVRGADTAGATISHWAVGEPPRARGRLGVLTVPAATFRRTPACAGPTATRAAFAASTRENPRVRGADDGRGCDPRPFWGEPPRARGRRDRRGRRATGSGRTPACAGPTPPKPWRSRCDRENPRVRGADPPPTRCRPPPGGEPPRARGLRHRRC